MDKIEKICKQINREVENISRIANALSEIDEIDDAELLVWNAQRSLEDLADYMYNNNADEYMIIKLMINHLNYLNVEENSK